MVGEAVEWLRAGSPGEHQAAHGLASRMADRDVGKFRAARSIRRLRQSGAVGLLLRIEHGMDIVGGRMLCHGFRDT